MTEWRVQWYSRPDVGMPERAQGRQDFTDAAAARAWFTSDEVRGMVGPYWRVELQRREPWLTVETGAYCDCPEDVICERPEHGREELS